MANIKIRSAFSTQPSTARPNPFVEKVIGHIDDHLYVKKRQLSCADQGCGKLRHLPLLLRRFSTVVLIDTEEQLSRTQQIWRTPQTTIREYAKRLKVSGGLLSVVSSEEFERSRLKLDVIFSVCVLDVEIPRARDRIVRAGYRNLTNGGLLVLIVPRNDQTITVRCTGRNRFLDGHFFRHHGTVTFYRNFTKTADLKRLVEGAGFSVLDDLSTYRQLCLVCRK